MEISPAADTLGALGDTLHLSAVAKDANGDAIPGKIFTWQSSAPLVASVESGQGVVTALANGTTAITATSDNKSGQAVLWVIQVPAAVEITPSADTLTALGQTRQLAAAAKDAGGSPIAGRTFRWGSSDRAVATVDSTGLATAAGNGGATIWANVDDATGTASLTVRQTVSVVDMVSPRDTLRALGDTVRFLPVLRDARGNPVHGKPVNWTSSDRTVATVDSTGLATAAGNGSATIWASVDDATGTASLIVMQTVIVVDLVSPRDTLRALGDTVRFLAIPRDARGNPVHGKPVNWASSNSAVAIIDTLGLATARKDGATTVTGTVNNVTGSASLAVKQTGVALSIRAQPTEGAAGVPFAVQPIVEVLDARGGVVANDNATMVTATIASGGGALLGNRTRAATAGVVVYADLAIGGTVGSRILSFASQGLTAATSNPLSVIPGPAVQSIAFGRDSLFWWTESLPSSVSDSDLIALLGGVALAKDAYGNAMQLGSLIWNSWPAAMSRTKDAFNVERREFVGWLRATDPLSDTMDSVHVVAMHNLEGADFRETWTCVRASWWQPSDGDSVIGLNAFDSLYYDPNQSAFTTPSRAILAKRISRTSWRYFGTDSVTVFSDGFSPVLIGTQTVPDTLNHLVSAPGRPRRYVGVTVGCGESREMVVEEIP